MILIGKRLNLAFAEPDADNLIAIGDQFDASALKEESNTAIFRQKIRDALIVGSHNPENTWMTEFSEDFFFWTPGTFKYVCSAYASRAGPHCWSRGEAEL